MKVLIVGSGFAGSSLSYFLCKHGIQVDIITNPLFDQSSSSSISAGIMLPFSGKRKTLSYNVSNALPFALEHYRNIQSHSKLKILFDLPVRQLLTDARDYNDWFSKTNEKETGHFIDHINRTAISDKLKNHIGYLQFRQANAVYSSEIFKAYAVSSPCSNMFLEQFDFSKLAIHGVSIKYKNLQYDKLIFCEGYRSLDNPLWNKLPFKPVKGEIMDIQAGNLNIDFILNSSLYIIPLGEGKYKVGATYNWKEINEVPSQVGIQYLKSEFEKIASTSFEIISHKAGIRPAIQDRRPVIGFHPKYKSIGIFNGLGTKGAMLSPYYASMLANHIVNNSPIDSEVSVDRFSNTMKVQIQ